MTNLEIGLIVALVVVLLICVVFMWTARKTWYHERNGKKEFESLYNSCSSDLNNAVAEIGIADVVSRSLKSHNKDLTDQLKQIKDLREAGKEWQITLAFLDDEKKHVEENFAADRVEFIAGDEGIVAFYLGADEDPVYCIERENYILHKKELVDIEKPEDEK